MTRHLLRLASQVGTSCYQALQLTSGTRFLKLAVLADTGDVLEVGRREFRIIIAHQCWPLPVSHPRSWRQQEAESALCHRLCRQCCQEVCQGRAEESRPYLGCCCWSTAAHLEEMPPHQHLQARSPCFHNLTCACLSRCLGHTSCQSCTACSLFRIVRPPPRSASLPAHRPTTKE